MKRKKLLSVIALSSLVAFCGLTTIVSCGGEEETQTTTYTVTCASSNDYTITGLLSSYAAGDTVTFTVTPAQGKVITSVTANGNPLTEVGGKYSFAMPEANVTIVVNVTDATYDFVVSYDGNWAVGDFVTVSATIEGTATTDFTIEVTEGSSIATVDATAKTISFSGPGTVTVVVSATHNGVELSDTRSATIVGVLATLNPTTMTNLRSTIPAKSTYLTSDMIGDGLSDTIGGVTFNYLSTDFGISGSSSGYSNLGALQTRSSGLEKIMWNTTELVEVTRIDVTYLNTYDTLKNENFVTFNVGNTAVTAPDVIGEAVATDYENTSGGNSFTINTFECTYNIPQGSAGVLSMTGANYTGYLTDIVIYGRVIDSLPEPTAITLTASSTSINLGERAILTATTTPVSADGTISYNVKEGSEFVTIDDNTVVGVAAGTAVVNATITYGDNQTLTSNDVEITVNNVSLYDNAVEVTVAELLDLDPTADLEDTDSDTVLYEVTGIATEIQSSKYGNMNLYDKTTGESIMVYGTTAPGKGFTYEEGYYYFDNDKTWPTVSSQVAEGDEITVYALYGEFNGTLELVSEFKEVVNKAADLAIYSISSTLPEYVTASKSTELTFGEEVTLTVDSSKLPDGQEIAAITHNGSALTEESDGTYKFNAHVNNVIEVTTREAGTYNKVITLTATSLGLGGSYSSSTASLADFAVEWIDLMANSGNIQTNKSDSRNTSLWNTSAAVAEIESIELVPGGSGIHANATFEVSFGTEVMTTSAASTTSLNADTRKATNTVAGATYFNITRGGRNASYLESIIVTLK